MVTNYHADVSLSDNEGLQPLHHACFEGHIDVVKLLLKEPVDIEAKSSYGSTPLDYACWKGYKQIVRCLLDAKPSANTQVIDGEGWSPLISATAYEHSDIMELLLKTNPKNIDHPRRDGDTALHIASREGFEEGVELLLKHQAKADVLNDMNATPLFLAAMNGHESVVRALAQNCKPALSIKAKYGLMPLHIAAYNRNESLLKSLWDADHSIFSQNFEIAWADALEWNALGMAKTLLSFDQYTLTINDKIGKNSETALHVCCRHGYKELAELLLKHGADVTAKDYQGCTPLHRASEQGSVEIVKILLDANASVGETDEENKTALHYASEANSQEVESQRPEKPDFSDLGMGDDWSSQSDEPILGRYEAVISLLRKHGARPGAKTGKGKTALHLAATHRDPARAGLIIDGMSQRDIQATDKSGKTALCIAFENARSEATMICILDNMELADFGNSDGAERLEYEALMWAAESSIRHKLATMLLLKYKRGGRLFPAEKWGAIRLAAYRGMYEVLWLLIASSPPNVDTQKSINSALEWATSRTGKEKSHIDIQHPNPESKGERQEQQEGKGKRTTHRPTSSGKQAADQGDIPTDMSFVEDILYDPPVTVTSESKEPFEPPEMVDSLPEIAGKPEATIVQFYNDDKCRRSGLLQRSRSVKETIYGSGPKRIMDDAKELLRKMVQLGPQDLHSTHEAAPNYDLYLQNTPMFTWVHLPSTNVRIRNSMH